MSYVRFGDITPFDFRGLQICELTPEPLSSASIAQIEVPPEVAHPKAKSTHSDKIYVCVGGTVTFNVGGDQVELGFMDVLVVPRNEWFCYSNRESKVAQLLLVHVPPFNINSEVFSE